MAKHLQRDLDDLKKEILQLGALVENAINSAIISLNNRRPKLAREVIAKADEIDDMEVRIEEECLKILALHQPVAVDLRFIVVVLKVNNDLERMGDFAVNIAQRALYLNEHQPIKVPETFTNILPEHIRKMIRLALDALVQLDIEKAQQVIDMDDFVDDVNRKMYVDLQELMRGDVETIERAVQYLSSSRYIERIADLTTNIAEDVIFMTEGEVIRHQKNKQV